MAAPRGIVSTTRGLEHGREREPQQLHYPATALVAEPPKHVCTLVPPPGEEQRLGPVPQAQPDQLWGSSQLHASVERLLGRYGGFVVVAPA